MIRISLFLAFSLFSFVLKAQHSKIPLIDSREVIKTGIELYDKEKYDEAIAELSKVSVNDTNYAWSLYEKSYTFSAKNLYDSSIFYAQKGIKLKSEYTASFYLLLGSSFHDSEKYEEALKIYEEGIQKFPTDYRLHANKGLSFYYLWKLNEAVACFQKAIELNYYNKMSHKMLGLICLKQNQPTRGALSILTYLTINPQDTYASPTIVALEKYLTENITYDPDSLVFIPNDDFQSTDLILNSHITFNKNFKLKSDFDFKVIRQSQAMLEKLPYDASSEDFWMKKYVPFFKDLWAKGYFNDFTSYWLAGVQEKAQKKFEKNDSDIKKLKEYSNEAFTKIELLKTLDFNGKIGNYKVGTYGDHNIQAITSDYNESTQTLKGYTEYYHENYVLSGRGSYNENGEKTGHWDYFDQNGDLTQTIDYKPEDSLFTYKNYFSSGGLSSEGKYKNDLDEGEALSFYIGGGKKYETNFRQGIKEGKSFDYFENGGISFEGNYVNGKLDGLSKKYYNNGKLLSESNYKYGEEDGPYIAYHLNGKKKVFGLMSKDEAQGIWEYYDIKGNIINKIAFKDNLKEGISSSYFSNGKLSLEGNFSKGEPIGSHKYYDEDGKIFVEEIYEKANVKTIKCFSKNGSIIKENSKKGDILNYEVYFPNGQKKSEGKMNKQGYDGLVTEYYMSGGKLSEKQYKDGKLNGTSKEYFEIGTLQSESEYKSGELDGYYTLYHQNGKISIEGWYIKDQAQGDWRYYYTNGIIKDKLFFKDNLIDGYNANFHPNGNKDMEYFVENGVIKTEFQYDSLGNVFNKIEIPNGNAKISHLNFKKNPYKEFILKSGVKQGEEISKNIDGTIGYKRFYKNDLLEGLASTFYLNGAKKNETEYQNNLEHGFSKTFYDNGIIEFEGSYDYGIANGVSKWYNYDGQLETTIQLEDHKRHGEFVFFGEDGKTAAYKILYNNNHIEAYTYLDKTGNWLPFKKVENGTFEMKAYYPNGKVSYQGSFIKNQRNGTIKRFYMNGNLHSENNFKNGINDGLQKECFINGKTRKLYFEKDDILDGPSTTYFENGKVKYEENYAQGFYHGKVKEYDMNGKIIKDRNYYFGIEY